MVVQGCHLTSHLSRWVSRPQYFHRRMRGGGTVLDHEFGEYPFEMLCDSTDFGGEDNRDLGVAFPLAQPEKDLRFAAS